MRVRNGCRRSFNDLKMIPVRRRDPRNPANSVDRNVSLWIFDLLNGIAPFVSDFMSEDLS